MTKSLAIEIVGQFMRESPVDVEGLARALDLKIVRRILPDNESGKIECDAAGPCVVTVNAIHPRTRQRFTLAHEIAHFILHRDEIGDGITDNGMYRSGRPERIEREANRYAADILMPWRLVIEKVRSGKSTAIELAREFDVSAAVAEIRLKELQAYL